MAAVVALALIGCALSLSLDYPILAVIFAVLAPVGALGYWLVAEYPELYEIDASPDLASRQTVVGSLVKLAIFCVAFAILGYFWVVFDWATAASLLAVPPTLSLAAAGVLPGAFLGAGVPVLAQRGVVFHRLQNSSTGQFVGNLLTLGAFLALLDATPAAVSSFVVAYASSRVAILVGWQAVAGD